MKKTTTGFLFFTLSLLLVRYAKAQNQNDIFHKLDSVAIVQRKVMVPMRDGIKLSTNIYRPKTDKKVPIIFVKTPYNFNRWQNGKERTRTAQDAYDAIEHGYAYVIQNHRGRYFSQGKWRHLGAPISDASDMYKWMRNQPWSNKKIGLRGCSSTAEWQLGAASVDNPADAMVPMGYPAGIGKVGRFHEQGNFYRGGVVQIYKAAYIGGVDQDNFRPMVPDSATQEDLIRISRYYDLAPNNPAVDWSKAIRHLPIMDVERNIHGKDGMFNRQITRKPNDKAWFDGGLYDDDMNFNVPSFWFASWYGIGVSTPLKLYNYVRNNAPTAKLRENQYLVIAPTTHCGYFRSTKNTMVGDRNVGDARLNYNKQIYDWLDMWLKGDKNNFKKNTPHVQYYTMGSNEWKSAETWPPKNTKMTSYYFQSEGRANSLYGDGKLSTAKPKAKEHPDQFTYDPMNPVPSHGGGACCAGNSLKAGSFDQRQLETRDDILVYSTKPLEKGIEITGFIQPILYVSSDVKDTDFNIKLVDVSPDGTAYNIRSTIFRTRYREGFDKEVFMKKGKVYKIEPTPMATSNYFKKGHRIRIEITSSNFPHFARNLNTGGNNYDEKRSVVAHNKIHHSIKYPSHIQFPIAFK